MKTYTVTNGNGTSEIAGLNYDIARRIAEERAEEGETVLLSPDGSGLAGIRLSAADSAKWESDDASARDAYRRLIRGWAGEVVDDERTVEIYHADGALLDAVSA